MHRPGVNGNKFLNKVPKVFYVFFCEQISLSQPYYQPFISFVLLGAHNNVDQIFGWHQTMTIFHILLLTNHKLRFVTFTHSSSTFYYDGSKMVPLVEVREVWLTGMRCNYKSGQPNTEPNVQDLYFYVWQYFVVGLCQPFLFLLSPTTMTTIIDSLFRAIYWTLPTEMQISLPFFVLPQIPRHAQISAASYNKLGKPFLRHR